MDAKLRRALDAIARDNHSGAAEIALGATNALQDWLGNCPCPGAEQLMEVARQLAVCKPRMIPLLRLANGVAIAADGRQPGAELTKWLNNFRSNLITASKRIARQFRLRLARPKLSVRVVTYSYSSTVLRALLAAKPHMRCVICSEARPGYEGRHMARPLAGAGIRVEYKADADLFSGIEKGDVVLVGADAVLRDAFCNRTGTEGLLLKALDVQASFVVAADTTKFWPSTRLQQLGWEVALPKAVNKQRPKSIWAHAPRRVDAWYYEESWLGWTSFRPGMRFLTEEGWMTPRQVRAEMKKIRISPRLKTLID